MAIYKIQSPTGEIITIEGPDGATQDEIIQAAQANYKPAPVAEKSAGDYLKQFGQASASLADTVLGAPAALGQQLSYGVGRAFGLSPEEATASSLKATQPFMNPVGNAFGVTNTPGYQGEASRAVPAAAIGAVAPSISQATGLPQQDVESMINTGLLAAAPAAGRGARAVGKGVYAAEPYIAAAAKAPIAVAKAPFQFAKGAYEGVMNPEHNPATSSMQAMGKEYYPQPVVERFMGEQPNVPSQTVEQLRTQGIPTSEVLNTPLSQAALKLAPKDANGNPLIPYEGQGMQAWGERVGRGVRTHPLQAMGEVGLTALTGIPFKTIGQGISEAGARYLTSKTGLHPKFQEQIAKAQAASPELAQTLAGYQSGNIPMSGPVAGPIVPPTVTPAAQPPRLTYTPVAPEPTPTLYASPTGEVSPSLSVQHYNNPASYAERQAAAAQLAAAQPKAVEVAPVAPVEVAAPVAAPVAERTGPTPDQLRALLEAKKTSPTVVETTKTSEVTAPIAPEELAPAFEYAKKASDILSPESIAAAAELSKAEIRAGVKGTATAAVTTKKGMISLNKQLYNDIASRHGATIDWAAMPELSKSVGEARKQVSTFVWEQIKPSLAKETRGPQHKTMVKAEQALETVADKAALELSTKERADALRNMLTKRKAPGMSMMTDEAGQHMIDVLAGKFPEGSRLEGNKVITTQPAKQIGPPGGYQITIPAREIAVDATTGKRVPVKNDWSEIDPEPLTSIVGKKLNKGK